MNTLNFTEEFTAEKLHALAVKTVCKRIEESLELAAIQGRQGSKFPWKIAYKEIIEELEKKGFKYVETEECNVECCTITF